MNSQLSRANRTRSSVCRTLPFVLALQIALIATAIASSSADTRNHAQSRGQQSRAAAHTATRHSGKTQAMYSDLRARAWKMLDEAVNSEKVRNRSDGFSAISILKSDPHAIRLMTQGLQDKDEGVRALAATSLGRMNATSAIPALRKAMSDPSPVVSFAAAQALWSLGDHSGRELLYDVLAGQRKTKPGVIKSNIEQIKKDIHDPKTLALIGIDQASGAFLGPFSMVVSVVEEYAKNTSSPVQAYCASLLAQDDTPDTIEQLSLALDNNNWTVRAAAAKALAQMRDRKVIPKLEEMMETDKDPPARLAAAAAIVKVTQP